MTFSEALEKVNQAYLPGVVAFYGKADPDPWQKAHDSFESLLIVKDPDLILAGLESFVSRCLELIDTFKKTATPARQISVADAFHIGNENKFCEMWSRKKKECFKCGSKSELQIITSPTDQLSAAVICKSCKGG